MNQDVVSFVLRFIREESGGQPARWRGVIKHVQSDHSADFTHFNDALQFMQAHVDEAIRQAFVDQEPLTPDNMLAETARLWGEVAPRYTDFMLAMLEPGAAHERVASPKICRLEPDLRTAASRIGCSNSWNGWRPRSKR